MSEVFGIGGGDRCVASTGTNETYTSFLDPRMAQRWLKGKNVKLEQLPQFLNGSQPLSQISATGYQG